MATCGWTRYNRAAVAALVVPLALCLWNIPAALLLMMPLTMYAVLIRPAFGECYCAACKARRGPR